MTDTDTVQQPPRFEIQVRFHGLNPEPGPMKLEGPADIEQAQELAARWANGLWQPGGAIPAEVLVVGEWGPVDRWLDGHRAPLESLTSGHPGGCVCGECVIRWQHREGDPRHAPCSHGACPVCNGCNDCDWNEIQVQLQTFADNELSDAAYDTGAALDQVRAARLAFVHLRREVSESERDFDGLPRSDITAAIAKLDRIQEELADVARIVEAAQLRAKAAKQES